MCLLTRRNQSARLIFSDSLSLIFGTLFYLKRHSHKDCLTLLFTLSNRTSWFQEERNWLTAPLWLVFFFMVDLSIYGSSIFNNVVKSTTRHILFVYIFLPSLLLHGYSQVATICTFFFQNLQLNSQHRHASPQPQQKSYLQKFWCLY